MKPPMLLNERGRLLRGVGWRLVHHHNQMAMCVVSEHLCEKVNHFSRCNPFFVKPKQQPTPPTNGRHSCNAAPFTRNGCLGRLAARSPRLAEKGRQGNVRFILKVENSPIFLHCPANFGNLLAQPRLAGFFVDFVVFAFRLLVSEARIAEPSPHRVARKTNVKPLLNHLSHTPDRPQIGFVAKIRRFLQDDLAQVFYRQFLQLPWPSTPRPTLESLVALQAKTPNPSKYRNATNAIHLGNHTRGNTIPHRFHGTLTNLHRQMRSVAHNPRLIAGKLLRVKTNVTFFMG